MWSERLEKITSVSEQLCSHVALNIMMNLEDAHSTYAQSFHLVKREIAKVSTLLHLSLITYSHTGRWNNLCLQCESYENEARDLNRTSTQ